jgi:2-polyprenyl-3-methyl-5-hydroxy-6-metoxy-1,4-benzoquinol methylase
MEEEANLTSEAATLSPKTYQPVACILCGSTETQAVARKGMFGWETYVSICPHDGLVFLNPRWTKADYDQRKGRIVWERLKAQAGETAFSATPDGETRLAALDIGCGLGWNLHNLAQNIPGLEIYGIEPSDVCSEHFTKKLGGSLIARDVDSSWEQDYLDRFNVIVFRHVLEHLMNPVETLKKVNQALAPDGFLYIAVPDMLHPDGSLENFWYRCVHTYYYSKVTLERIAALAGLKPITIQEQNAELWAIFQKASPADKASEQSIRTDWPNVFEEQLAVIHSYQRQRRLRSLLLRLSPKTLSSRMPRSLKGLIPARWKARFRHLVYRH